MPGDGDFDVDAEHAGQEGGGKFGGELEQRGGACLAGLDAEGFEALSEVGGVDRAAGLAAGKQPGRGCCGSGGGVSAFAVQDAAGEVGDGLGQGDGRGADTRTSTDGCRSSLMS